MRVATLLVGILVGATLLGGALAMTGQVDVNADAVCENEYGESWSGEQVDADAMNQSATVVCSNGTQTERIVVEASLIEVNS
jgi:hypothetical protein